MKQLILCTSAALLTACHGSRPVETQQQKANVEVASLEQPESALHDAASDVYLVSNVAGSPFEKDGRGFISRIASDGRILDREFIGGLDAPKGLAIHGDILAVADLTVLRRFRRDSGAPIDVVNIEGSTFLNDVAAADDGSFYVSDSGFRAEGQDIAPTGTDAVYRISPDGKVQRILSGETLAMPNGLVVRGDELLVATFGAAKLLRFGLDGAARGEVALPKGQLDGLVALPTGCLLVSSLEAGALFSGLTGGAFQPAMSVLAMDIGFDAQRSRVLLPMMMDNRLRVVPVEGLDTGCE